MRGGIRVSIAAPAVLLESTYLSVFVFDPVAVETLAPERTLRVLGIVPLSSAGEAPEFMRARKARGSRRHGRGSARVPFAQPATNTMFGGPVRPSARLALTGTLAPFSRVAPPPAVLAEGATGTSGSGRDSARLTENEDALANEGVRVGAGCGIPDVEVDRGPGASLGLTVDACGARGLPERPVYRPAESLDDIGGDGARLGGDVAEVWSTPDLQVARQLGEPDPRCR